MSKSNSHVFGATVLCSRACRGHCLCLGSLLEFGTWCATLSCDVDAIAGVFGNDVMFKDVDLVINGEHECVALRALEGSL